MQAGDDGHGSSSSSSWKSSPHAGDDELSGQIRRKRGRGMKGLKGKALKLEIERERGKQLIMTKEEVHFYVCVSVCVCV